MTITATEFKINLGKYIDMAMSEDIYISKNNKIVAKLGNPYEDRVSMARSLIGVLDDDGSDYDDLRWEGLKERHEIDD